ncbi:hypothetical protein MLD38_032333 [Melastoma candidum]|uniref:Uncharacterized protein n=1 Tax=Melastoma candidum TaxID=119954 RepID=A0ACB9M3F3_9MYRT|nr:hypothetical protein MLD38_032333 [Melastoma candidum]
MLDVSSFSALRVFVSIKHIITNHKESSICLGNLLEHVPTNVDHPFLPRRVGHHVGKIKGDSLDGRDHPRDLPIALPLPPPTSTTVLTLSNSSGHFSIRAGTKILA